MSTADQIAIQAQYGWAILREHSEALDEALTPLRSRLLKLSIEHLRPKGYSQSHWRKILKERFYVTLLDTVRYGSSYARTAFNGSGSVR